VKVDHQPSSFTGFDAHPGNIAHGYAFSVGGVFVVHQPFGYIAEFETERGDLCVYLRGAYMRVISTDNAARQEDQQTEKDNNQSIHEIILFSDDGIDTQTFEQNEYNKSLPA